MKIHKPLSTSQKLKKLATVRVYEKRNIYVIEDHKLQLYYTDYNATHIPSGKKVIVRLAVSKYDMDEFAMVDGRKVNLSDYEITDIHVRVEETWTDVICY